MTASVDALASSAALSCERWLIPMKGLSPMSIWFTKLHLCVDFVYEGHRGRAARQARLGVSPTVDAAEKVHILEREFRVGQVDERGIPVVDGLCHEMLLVPTQPEPERVLGGLRDPPRTSDEYPGGQPSHLLRGPRNVEIHLRAPPVSQFRVHFVIESCVDGARARLYHSYPAEEPSDEVEDMNPQIQKGTPLQVIESRRLLQHVGGFNRGFH